MSEKEVTLLSRSPQTCFQSQLEASNINLHIKQEHEMLWQYVQHNWVARSYDYTAEAPGFAPGTWFVSTRYLA